MAVVKIDQKIVTQRLADKSVPDTKVEQWDGIDRRSTPPPVGFANTKRPTVLHGSTYKIKSPLANNATYVTINNHTTIDGQGVKHTKPFEIFIEGKDVQHHQWVKALTRVISGFFRADIPFDFIARELQEVHDPQGGGYMKRGVGFMPSLVAEIGSILELHFRELERVDVAPVEKTVDEPFNEWPADIEEEIVVSDIVYPESATLCPKCNQRALIRDGGCNTCRSCDYTSCG